MLPNRYFVVRQFLFALLLVAGGSRAVLGASLLNSPPSFPINLSPSGGAFNVPFNAVTLRWNPCTDADGDAIVYDVYLGADLDPPVVASGVTGTSYDPGPLQVNTRYYWQIVARDAFGNATPGVVWNFRTAWVNSPPAAASSPSPGDDATFQPTSVTLRWESSDPDGQPISYQLYLGTNNPPPFHGSVATASYLKTGLLEGYDYYWRIVTFDNQGTSTEGPVWKFRTNIKPLVTLTSPANGASNVPVGDGLSWQGSDGDGDPVTYNVYFGTNVPLPLIASNVAQDHISLPMGSKTHTAYSWRIDVVDNHGGTTTSPTRSFTTRPNYVPGAAILEGPANGGSSSNPALLRWTGNDPDSPPQFLFYIVYLGTSNPPPEIASNISNTSYLASDLQNGVQYFWRVETWDGFNSSLSDVWSFTPGDGPLTGAGDIPAVLTLGQNHPNPFNPQTTIPYSIPNGKTLHVRLVIYDTSGRAVRELVNEDQSGGVRSVVWNGQDDHGTGVASGVYYCVLEAGDDRRTQKLVLLK